MSSQTPLYYARALHLLWKEGKLGGEFMPEDAKPEALLRLGDAALAYFTLPMALNYQRNSYKLWEAATKAWQDKECRWIFEPRKVEIASLSDLQKALLKHKVALQPNKHPQTWQKICLTLCQKFDGSFEKLLKSCEFNIGHIKQLIQIDTKAGFPYLAGMKICNYWLYVLTQYTDYTFSNRAEINIAPDTHVLKASCRLGLISEQEALLTSAQALVTERWKSLLLNSGLEPIDMHTPLWLWSRSGFPNVIEIKTSGKAQSGIYR